MSDAADQPDGEASPTGPDLDALYRRLQPALLRHLSTAYAWQAEDIAADVWAEVAAGLSRFEGDDDAFRGWVFTLARRRLSDSYRRAGRRPTDPLPEELAPTSAERPEDDVVARLSAEATIARLNRLLPPDHARIVLLRVVYGMTVQQVAALTDKQPVNVRVIQHRALRRLAGRFEQQKRSA
ncbi:MAG TPA: sigma-70 family RNA polymerase sigma factor [Acidimicrobiales bacterium]